MPQFIPVTIDDFEEQFNVPNKKDPTKRAFEMHTPKGQEIFYTSEIYSNDLGRMVVKVLTTVPSNKNSARDVGKDAIRIFLVWEDNNDWTFVLKNDARVFRSGGVGKTAKDVVERTLDRARNVAKSKSDLRPCNKCGRPMILRTGKYGNFYGCIAFKKEGCNNIIKA